MADFVQTSYGEPAVGYAGQLADNSLMTRDVASANNASATGIAAGLAVLRAGERLCRPILATDEPVADPDAIIASGVVTSAAAQIILAASYNGVVGAAVFSPPRNTTLTLNAHADWDASTIVVEGLGAAGEPVSEAFEVPNGGGVVLTGVVSFTKYTAVKIPAQSGVNGTLLVGLGVKLGAINRAMLGISVYNQMREPGLFAQFECLDVLRRGRIYVLSEGSVSPGDPVYVRFVAVGAEVRGAFRATPDSTDCALVEGATWASLRTGAGLATLDLSLS